MAKIPFDCTFERHGRPLAAWLVDLVGPDPAARRAAGDALHAMWSGAPSVHTNVVEVEWPTQAGIEAHMDQFRAAARAAVRSPALAASGFVPALIGRRIALREEDRLRNERELAENEAPHRIRDRLLRRLEMAQGEAEQAEAVDRYMRWECARTARRCRRSRDPNTQSESTSSAGFMTFILLNALDVELLADRPGLRRMLADDQLRGDAIEALGRIGPPALDFAPDLLAGLDATERSRDRWGEATALGSIAREIPELIEGLLRRLRSGPPHVRAAAACALQAAGPPLAGRLEAALDLLFGATGDPDLRHAAIPALASLGRDREAALDHVLALARPRPPRWSTERFGDYEHRGDEVMYERGVAIDSLTFFEGFADRVVPPLIDALDSFEEYDSDWSYGGERARVCSALKSFGPRAAPAVPRLMGLVEEWLAAQADGDSEWPKDVFGVLGAIGPAAASVLPLLEQVRGRQFDDANPPTPLDPDDLLDAAILRIQGE